VRGGWVAGWGGGGAAGGAPCATFSRAPPRKTAPVGRRAALATAAPCASTPSPGSTLAARRSAGGQGRPPADPPPPAAELICEGFDHPDAPPTDLDAAAQQLREAAEADLRRLLCKAFPDMDEVRKLQQLLGWQGAEGGEGEEGEGEGGTGGEEPPSSVSPSHQLAKPKARA
jgi:hypothetical protein